MGTWKNPWGLDGFLELAGFLLASMLNLMTILYGDILGSSRRYIAHGTCVGETPPMAIFLSKGARGTTFQTHRKWGNMARTPSTHRYQKPWEVPSRWQTKLCISSLFLPYNHTEITSIYSGNRMKSPCLVAEGSPVQFSMWTAARNYPVVFASKFLPTIARWSRSSFHNALRRSCERLGSTCDIYFLHTPIHPLPLEFWISCACEAAKAAGQKFNTFFFFRWFDLKAGKKLLREVHETYLPSFQGFIFLPEMNPWTSLKIEDICSHRHSWFIISSLSGIHGTYLSMIINILVIHQF